LRSYVPLPNAFLTVVDASCWNIAICFDQFRPCPRPMSSSCRMF
jgi:hypothetical protein